MEKGGVMLLGLDLPSKPCEDGKIRIFVSVRVTLSTAPTHIALVVKAKTPSADTRTSQVTKLLVGEMAIGIELPMYEKGAHDIQVMVCAATQEEIGSVLFVCEPKQCVVRPKQPSPALPRLMQQDSLVLCGVDIPSQVEGDLRIMVALKRVWNDAPRDVALIVRNTLPSGEKRAAVVHRCLGEDAEAFGLCVPMGEAGVHTISCQIAKKVDGELIEVFLIEERKVSVSNPAPRILAESRGVQLVGVDVPDKCQGSFRAIVAVQRSESAPSKLCLLMRNTLPDGSLRCAKVYKEIQSLNASTIGIEVPMCEAGKHLVELTIAEEQEDGSLEVLLRMPPVSITVTNPPMPKLRECTKRSVVLCGIDINGARWPSLIADAVADDSMRVQIALARTWEDAPTEYALVVTEMLPCGKVRQAVTLKAINDMEPVSVGMKLPVIGAGDRLLVVVVAEVMKDGEYCPIFSLPPVRVHAPISRPAAFDRPAAADYDVLTELAPEMASQQAATEEISRISLKVIYSAPQCDKVIRRLTVPINKTLDGIPIRGYVTIMDALKTAFCTELAGRDARLGYIDDDGDSIVVSSDAELKVALKLVTGAAGYVRLYINPL